MNKSKKGAEPKRLRHVIKEIHEFFHLSINRNEYCIGKANGVTITSAFGYFFIGCRDTIKEIKSKKDIIDNWETNTMSKYTYPSRGFRDCCFAIYNKRKNVLIIDSTRYPNTWYLRNAVNKDCNIIIVNSITDYNILNKPKALAKDIIIYNIDIITKCLSNFYKIIKGYSTKCNFAKIYSKSIVQYIDTIRTISNNYPSIPKDKVLCKSYVYISNKHGYQYIDCPTINQIINYKIFNKEEVKLIHQRKFWTENGFGKGISFKEVQANWNTKVNDTFYGIIVWQKLIVKQQAESLKIINKKIAEIRTIVEQKRKRLIDEILSLPITEQLKRWREQSNEKGYDRYKIVYDDFANLGRRIKWFKHTEFVNLECFDNKQLKLSKDGKEVITNSSAKVTLTHALYLFNKLFNKYIAPKLAESVQSDEDYKVDFTNKNITIGYYPLRSLGYCKKVTDYNHVSKGYKEWYVEIGCHVLWLDDVKEFCRYYHLENKVNFDCKEVKR